MRVVLWRATVFVTNFILLLSIEHVLAIRRYEFFDRYPSNVLQMYIEHGNVSSKRSVHSNDVNFYKKTNIKQVLGMYQDENVELSQHNDLTESLNEHELQQFHTCVKCPKEITLIARQGFDGALIEIPAPISCKTNLPFSGRLYRIETLFGPDVQFLLPQGRHTIIGKIRDVETGVFIRVCHLKYHVIVQRCPHRRVKNRKLLRACTADNIWGSKCAFQCKNHLDRLTHNELQVCDANSEWSGREPGCVPDNGMIDNTMPESTTDLQNNEFCERPADPANGHFICELLSNQLDENENHESFASGNVCKIECNPHYAIPFHLYPLSIIECKHGAWNLTDVELCYKKMPSRHHKLMRHRRTKI